MTFAINNVGFKTLVIDNTEKVSIQNTSEYEKNIYFP